MSATQVKKLSVLLLLLVLTGSSSNYSHLSSATLQRWLVKSPHLYFQVAPHLTITPEQASHSLVRALAQLPLVNWQYERLQRALGSHTQPGVKPLLLGLWHKLNQQQRRQLTEQLLQTSQWPLLSEVIKLGGVPESHRVFTQLAQAKTVAQLPRHKELDQYQLLNTINKPDHHCRYHIALIAADLKGLRQLQQLKMAFEQQPEPQAGVYCLSKPIYAAKRLSCTEKDRFAQCRLAASSITESFDYTVLMAAKGHANVVGQQMTLAHNSNYNVFIHELMHFSGFEDEYPVAAAKAKWLCAKSGFKAPNLYVGEHAPYNWAPSRTCEHGKLTSFKPQKGYSLLEYQSIKLSDKYRELWLQALHLAPTSPLSRVNSAE